MGKKLNTNPKAVEARERKEAQKKSRNESIAKQREDSYWKDEDKHVVRKLDRQKEKDNKAAEERARKAALKAAYEKDMELAEQSAKSKAARLAAEVPKVSRAVIQSKIEESNKMAELTQVTKQIARVNVRPTPLIPNLNKLEVDGENATSIDQALEILKPGAFKETPTSSSRSATKKEK